MSAKMSTKISTKMLTKVSTKMSKKVSTKMLTKISTKMLIKVSTNMSTDVNKVVNKEQRCRQRWAKGNIFTLTTKHQCNAMYGSRKEIKFKISDQPTQKRNHFRHA